MRKTSRGNSEPGYIWPLLQSQEISVNVSDSSSQATVGLYDLTEVRERRGKAGRDEACGGEFSLARTTARISLQGALPDCGDQV